MRTAVFLSLCTLGFITAQTASIPAECRFSDVMREPNGGPAVLNQATPLRPDLSGLPMPSRAVDVMVWVRVAADGAVTDVCVPDAPDGFLERLARAARMLRYTPARHDGRTVATAAAVRYRIEARLRGYGLQEQISASDDVAWLERMAASAEGAAAVWRSQPQPIGQAKDLRITAYARLGELATPASLSARKRIATDLRDKPLIAPSALLGVKWPHPGWHMSDPALTPLADAQLEDGERVAIIASDLLGPSQLFLLRCAGADRNRCARPKPFAAWAFRYIAVEASLRPSGRNRLELRVEPRGPIRPSIMDGTAPPKTPATPPAETHEIILPDVERDSDGDGWTDIEERLLGLDPQRADSDDDGIDDGRDRSPLYAAPASDVQDEEVAILQEAIFAVFGLSESRWALFVKDEKVRKIQARGISGPLLFNHPLKYDPATGGPGGVFVSWRMKQRTATEAVVEVSDWEGPLAAGGQEIFLRRIDGEWIVVARQTTWIS